MRIVMVNMAEKMQMVIATLIIITLLISAGALLYITTITSNLAEINKRLSAIEDALPGLTPPTQNITLRVIGPWAGEEMEAFLEVLEEFENQNPGIETEYVIYRAEQLATLLPLQFQAAMTPGDVIATAWGWFIAEQGETGHLLELNDLVNETDYISGIFDPVKVDGTIYGAPFTAWGKPGFWYRKSFFAAHGLTPPENWTEFVDLLEDIQGISGIVNPIVTGDGVGWPISDIAEHFIITFGGPELQQDLIDGTVNFTDPQVRSIFQDRIVSLLEAGYFSEPTEWTAAVETWWAGDYALYFMGTWLTGMVDDPTDLGLFALPGCEGAVLGTDYWIIPKYTRHLEEAKKLLTFLTGVEGQTVHVGTTAGKFATHLGVPLEAHWAPMQDVMEAMSAVEPVPDMDDTIGGYWQPLFWDQLKLLWVDSSQLDAVLQTLDESHPAHG
jgi:multiple sugar transport system substrate-binding protein